MPRRVADDEASYVRVECGLGSKAGGQVRVIERTGMPHTDRIKLEDKGAVRRKIGFDAG